MLLTPGDINVKLESRLQWGRQEMYHYCLFRPNCLTHFSCSTKALCVGVCAFRICVQGCLVSAFVGVWHLCVFLCACARIAFLIGRQFNRAIKKDNRVQKLFSKPLILGPLL